MRALGWLALLLTCALGCTGHEPRSTPGWNVWVGGCAEWRGPRCDLSGARALTFWLPESQPASVAVVSDAGPVDVTKASIQGGTRVALVVSAGVTRLVLSSGARRFVQPVAAAQPDPVLTRALSLRNERKFEEARALLVPLLADANPERRARAQGALARIDLREQRTAEAMQGLRAALAQGRVLKLVVMKRHDALALADTAYRRWDLPTMRAALAEIGPSDHEGSGEAVSYRALLSLITGDLEEALGHARSTQVYAQKLGLQELEHQGAQLELQVLTELGRVADGRARLTQLRKTLSGDPCRAAQLAANEGWLELSPAGDPRRAHEATERAVALYRTRCEDRFQLSNALVNLALSAYRLGQLGPAKVHLSEARKVYELSGWVLSWERDLDGAIALKERRPEEALSVYRDLLARSEVGAPLASQHRALSGLGRALLMLGRRDEALAAFTRAERVLDEEARRMPLGEGRETFSESRNETGAELVKLLVTAGDFAQALTVARWSRVRPLAALVERGRTRDPQQAAQRERALSGYLAARAELERLTRDAWAVPLSELGLLEQRTGDARRQLQVALEQVLRGGAELEPAAVLPPPSEGELGLYLFPLGGELYAFARTHDGVTVKRAPLHELPGDPAGLAALLLAPLRERLADARVLRVVAYGRMRDWDVHAWPLGEGVVLDQLPVVYGTELSAPSSRPPVWSRALVVKNPRRDLPHATREGQLVAKLLSGRGLTVTELAGRTASRAGVLGALPEVDVFHYAGHAELFGFAGWESRLLLASRELLEVSDVLALERVPSLVILSGCETGRESRDAGFSLGIAQAFIARGSALVLATTKRVPDPLGEALAPLVYREGTHAFGAESLTEALRSLRREGSGLGEWASYRLYVR